MLCIPATSVAGERLFFKAGDVIMKKQKQLKPSKSEMLVFLMVSALLSFHVQRFLVGLFILLENRQLSPAASSLIIKIGLKALKLLYSEICFFWLKPKLRPTKTVVSVSDGFLKKPRLSVSVWKPSLHYE